MKRYLFFIITLITSLLAFSCQDEDFGFTQEEIFREAYERNFIKAFGPIDPEENWDFSSYGRMKFLQSDVQINESGTRAGEDWYEVEPATLRWIHENLTEGNKDLSIGRSFGLLMGYNGFVIIPVYQSGEPTVNWTMNVMAISDTRSTTLASWNHSERIQVIGGEIECNTCHGIGMSSETGNDPCIVCQGLGHVKGTDHDCPNTDCVNGKINVICTACGGAGFTGTCSKCNGSGIEFVFLQNRGNWNFFTGWVGCSGCSKDSKTGGFPLIGQSYSKWTEIMEKVKGTGHTQCTTCSGSGKVRTGTCPICIGEGTRSDCTACGGDGKGTICALCGGSGKVANGEWHNIKDNEETTLGATKIRSNPLTVNTGEGSLVYFSLDITTGKGNYVNNGTKQRSLDNKMVVLPLDESQIPQNIKTKYPNSEVCLIGCEESGNLSGSDKDFNDLVFFVVGLPKVPTILDVQAGSSFTRTIQKRYMIEDFGDASDWDFNDIVIDIAQITKKKIATDLSKLTTESISTTGILRYLCGIAPVRIKVGGVEVVEYKYREGRTQKTDYWITDPTNKEQTAKQLNNQDNPSRSKYDKNNGFEPGWSPTFGFNLNSSVSNPKWTPSGNQIEIYVEKNEVVYKSTFPDQGEVPYIIATDVDVEWQAEGDAINRNPPSWWKPNVKDFSSNY